jgi:hypothetical protein
MLLKKFLNWSLKMLWPMSSYETSMLLLTTGIFVKILNGSERKCEETVGLHLD